MTIGIQQLTKSDAEYIALMLNNGILRQWEPHEFPSEDGTILLKCADGDRHRSMMGLYRRYVGSQRSRRDCHHPLQLNGTALRIASRSRFNEDQVSSVLIGDTFDAIALKRTPTVLILHHWPCAWGLIKGIPCASGMRLCFCGKDDIRHQCLLRQPDPVPEVRMGMHIDASYLNSCLGYKLLEGDDILFPDRALWMQESEPSGILGNYYQASREDHVLMAA